ncbi:Bax inhibitor-1/YccA family protein [Bifidobacterium aquikefiri]|uniref:Bax inhibitor-1/YccA family protein n=1 Tax=Bifidobacterium aquikefiri TaxID=1653207 RepID=UPI0039E88C42
MTFGRQPRSGQQPQDQQVHSDQTPVNRPMFGEYNYATDNRQSQYAASAYGSQPQMTMNGQTAYSYESMERATHASVTRAYGEMTLGLVLTAVVAVIAQSTGALEAYMSATGIIGWIALAVIQIGLAISLGARIMKMRSSTARLMFYVYAALMGFTLSSIFWAFSVSTIVITLGLCAAFFFTLTMIGMTTKLNMLKAGPILMVGLIVLIVSQVVLMFVAPSASTLRIVAAVGLLLFAGMTMYDAQRTRLIFQQVSTQGPEMVKKASILCALNLYLDFVNMFLYLLQLVGLSNN